ncbi:MAG: FMN-binding protein [Oscillospiraceae bacterium]|nr:FMN-binding protein [Oscillospiraceae bacterium]
MNKPKRKSPHPAPKTETPDTKTPDVKAPEAETPTAETPAQKPAFWAALFGRVRRSEATPRRPLSQTHPVLYMVVMLTSLTAVLAFLLGFVNGITAPLIERLRQEALVASVSEVLPGAAGEPEIVEGSWVAPVQTVRRAYSAAHDFVGYAVEVAPGGFGGPITAVVGVQPDGTVTGVRIIDMKETPNIGTKAQEPTFLDQFTGKTPGFVLGTGTDDVHVISGATVSSTAVYNGAAAASAAALTLK